MSTIKLVISDLHLADGHPMLEGFGDAQQAALEGLVNAASGDGPLGDAEDVELIINGDCFDFLAVPPYAADGTTTVVTATGKLEKIISVHRAFFETLSYFISLPGRHVTFLTGNHDIELIFEEVQAGILAAISGTQSRGQGANFCHTPFYRPLRDVYIEHGNQYDFWNHASDTWDEQGQPLQPKPGVITLPVGTQYFQRASHPISVQYPYFDHFEPAMDTMNQVALLCLLNPKLVIETARRCVELLSYPREALASLTPDEEHIPARLFAHAMLDFAAFQQDMLARKPTWVEPAGQEQSQDDAMRAFARLRDALELPLLEAVKNICAPGVYPMGESVANGALHVLRSDPTLRYVIAGHTHVERVDAINNGSQIYFNIGTWTTRCALPGAGEMTVDLVTWLRQPDWSAIPLRDMTRLTFAFISAEEGAPSGASLCSWEGGAKGSYRVLVQGVRL
jgi:UDP-2,3-diacylglucosamine pyrophosphatase LpxH